MKTKRLVLSILFLIVGKVYMLQAQQSNAFVIPDSLQNMSFEMLKKRFENNISTQEKSFIYGNAYYKKSKKQKDNIIIANGMYMAAYVTPSVNYTIALRYADSIINLTKNSTDFDYPAKGYLLRCDFLLKKTNLKEALINLLEAEKHSLKAGNFEQILLIKRQIALIKIELGNLNEALPLILENYNFYKLKDINSKEYIYSNWLLSDIYIRLNKPDEAMYYINNVLKNLNSSNRYYKYLIMYQGVCLHLKKQYQESDQLLDKAIFLLKSSTDKINLSITYYYRGENILNNESNLNKAKTYFIKADSIMIITKGYVRDIRPNYVRLIEIAKKQKKDKEQLYYLNRLIEIDQFLSKNNEAMSKSISKDYDTPHLLAQKEVVISSMNKEKYITIIVVCICFIGLGFYFLKNTREKHLLEERFNILMQQTQNVPDVPLITETILEVNTEIIKTKSNELSKENEEKILKKLDVFVKTKGYLKPNIVQTEFARQLKTNTTYLSIVVNKYMGKNFNQYINDLRIDYTVDKLKEDTNFRKYSIEAIAKEVGFGNTQSFSKAFLNKTGLQPSYFIKKLIEDAKKSLYTAEVLEA
jgi:AraC-like DNA-binding protein